MNRDVQLFKFVSIAYCNLKPLCNWFNSGDELAKSPDLATEMITNRVLLDMQAKNSFQLFHLNAGENFTCGAIPKPDGKLLFILVR